MLGEEVMRRAVNPTRKISITVPQSVFDHLNTLLSYDQSRSAYISSAIVDKMKGDAEHNRHFDIRTIGYQALLKWVLSHDDVDDTMKALLLQILSK